MSWWLHGAVVLTIACGLAHSYLGERYLLQPLLRAVIAPAFGAGTFKRRTLRLAWHVTSIAWWGSAALLWVLAGGDAALGLRVLGTTFLVTAAAIALGSRGRHLAWPVFLAIGVAAWAETLRS